MNLDDNCIDFFEVAMRILNEGDARDLELFVVATWSIWYNRTKNVLKTSSTRPTRFGTTQRD